ncbi:MAG: hypothetical protein FWD77_02080 [Betaproteobacteria bacterium]|nr:hypothetical protein [Betaproteobacteria bacterium]
MIPIPSSFPRPKCPSLSEGGYILIYMSAILLFMTTTVWAMAVSLRLEAQTLVRQKDNLQVRYTLEGAMQFAQQQFELHRAAKNYPELAERFWLPVADEHLVNLRLGVVRVRVEEAGLLPDANMLSRDEWIKLFQAMGGADEGQAALWASAIEDAKKLTRDGKFATISELLTINAIPRAIRYGAEDAAEGGEGGSGGKSGNSAAGLKDLLSVGSGAKMLEANRSPLLLFGVLIPNADESKLRQLDEARQKKTLTATNIQEIFGHAAQPFVYAGDSPWLRLILRMDDDSSGLVLRAMLKEEKDKYKLSEQRMVPIDALDE